MYTQERYSLDNDAIFCGTARNGMCRQLLVWRRRLCIQRTRVAPRASSASNSHRSARSKSLRRRTGSAVRFATSRNSTTFPRHYVAGDTSVSAVRSVTTRNFTAFPRHHVAGDTSVSAVRSATTRNSTAFPHHHVAGDTFVSVAMTFPPLSVAGRGKLRKDALHVSAPLPRFQPGMRATPCGPSR
jgi:hypothetical protein